MKQGISFREFGRRDGCSHVIVGRAVKAGHLHAYPDGSLDPSLVGTGWRERNRQSDEGGNRAAELPVTPAKRLPVAPPMTMRPDETPAEAAARLVTDESALVSRAEADRRTANYNALLKQLEWDERSGAVVPVADVVPIFSEMCSRIKTRFLSIPPENAMRLCRIKNPVEMQRALTDLVHSALTDLSSDQLGALSNKAPGRKAGR